MKNKPLHAVGANIFAGGFTLGVAKHFTVLAHLEHADRYGAEVAKANFKGLEVYAPENDAQVLDAWPKKFRERVDFVYANPPCAVWSTLGGAAQRGFDWRLDPRLQRVRDCLALIERYKPKVWCFESVCGAFTKGREFIDELVATAKPRGYEATFVLIDAQWHGLSQSRKRFFLVLHQVAIDWKAPSYDEPPSAFSLIKTVTPTQMGSVVPKRGTPLHALIKAARPGEPLAKTYDRIYGDDFPKNERGQAKHRLARSARRLGLDGVSGAVVSPWLWHPTEDRQLALEEFSVLTGFPPDYRWEERGKVRHDPTVRLMARGVMPPVAAWLAANIARAIRANLPVTTRLPTIADFRVAPGFVAAAPPTGIEFVQPTTKGARMKMKTAAPRTPRVKASTIDYDRLEKDAPPVPKGTPKFPTSGELIRHLLPTWKKSDVDLALMVRRAFGPGRKTTAADIAWNRARLNREMGTAQPRKRAVQDAPRAPQATTAVGTPAVTTKKRAPRVSVSPPAAPARRSPTPPQAVVVATSGIERLTAKKPASRGTSGPATKKRAPRALVRPAPAVVRALVRPAPAVVRAAGTVKF